MLLVGYNTFQKNFQKFPDRSYDNFSRASQLLLSSYKTLPHAFLREIIVDIFFK